MKRPSLCGKKARLFYGGLVGFVLLAITGRATATSWTASPPDAWVEQAIRVAEQADIDALARLVLAVSNNDRASAGEVRRQLSTLSVAPAPVADQAKWLAAYLRPERSAVRPLSTSQLTLASLPDPHGLLRHYALLGPFEDTGGGLRRREGPETKQHSFVDGDYSWGAYTVRYRRSLPQTADARGLPLDLYIHPRRETCTYLSSVVTVPAAEQPSVSFRVHVASSGSFRLLFDGHHITTDDEVHPRLLLDRSQHRLTTDPGQHLLTIKICSSARPDEGRLRIRFTDDQYRPVSLAASSDLQLLQTVAQQRGLTAGGTAAGLRVHVQPVPTLLERGLTPPARSPRAEPVLVAAILRTLGGAEDLQSPRAPGLLDQLTQHRALTTDQLTIAGLIAPAAANRSGWLQQAYRRALTAGDQASASVAQRALVQSRLTARLYDLAHATTQQPPLVTAQDAHASWLKALTLARLGGAGLKQTALRRLVGIAKQHAHSTPSAVQRSIARLSEYRSPRIFLNAMRRLAASEPEQRNARFVKAHRTRGAFALQRTAHSVMPWLRDSRQLTAIGQLLFSAGRYRAALHGFELATELNPNRAEAFRGLSRVRFALASDVDDERAALRALSRAKALQPHNAALNSELEFRRNSAGADGAAVAGSGAALDDTKYLVPASEFLNRRLRAPADPERQTARELHWRRVVVFHPDKRVSQLVHYAREIVIVPRTEAERYEDLPFGGPNTELLRARVHRADGAVLAPEEQNTPEGASPSVRWPRLERGDVVEVALRGWTSGPVRRRGDMPFYFVDYAGSVTTYPLLYNEVIIDSPVDDPLAFDVIGGRPDRQLVSEQAGRRTTRIIFERPTVIADEPFAPRYSELVPIVVGSPYPTWRAFIRWYQSAVAGFAEPDAQIRRLAAELTRAKSGRALTREQQIEALFNFVADDIRYVNYVSGEWWLPNRPQHLLARRQGDCDDKAILLISLLRAVGIEAREVLIQTRYTAQPSVLGATKAAIPMFDHGIVYLPPPATGPGANGLGRWLDATSPQSRMGSLPTMDGRARALILPLLSSAGRTAETHSAEAKIVATPAGKAADHGAAAVWRLALKADGSGVLQASERHLGDAAFHLRTHLREPDARAQWIEQHLLARWFPTLRVQPEVKFDGELAQGAATVGYRAQSRSLARREGDELVVVVAPAMPLATHLAPLAKRTLPVVLPPALAPRHHNLEIHITAPPGYEFADFPPDSTEDGKAFGRAEVSFSLAKGRPGGAAPVATIKRQISYEQSRIEVKDYQRWRGWLQRVDRLLRRGVRLRPTSR